MAGWLALLFGVWQPCRLPAGRLGWPHARLPSCPPFRARHACVLSLTCGPSACLPALPACLQVGAQEDSRATAPSVDMHLNMLRGAVGAYGGSVEVLSLEQVGASCPVQPGPAGCRQQLQSALLLSGLPPPALRTRTQT